MIEKIRKMIAQGQIEQALEALLDAVRGSSLENDLIHLQSRWNSLQREDRLGLIAQDVLRRESNKIVYALLQILDEVGPSQAKSTPKPQAIPEFSDREETKEIQFDIEESEAEFFPETEAPSSAPEPEEDLFPQPAAPAPTAPPSAPEPGFNRGKILYSIPGSMQLNEEAKCFIRIAINEEILLRNLAEKVSHTLQDIRISEAMTVELLDVNPSPAFAIRTLNRAEQFIERDAYTEWIFFVKPLCTGTFPITLKVSVIEIIMGKERFREIVLEEQITITSTGPSSAKEEEIKSVHLEPEKGIITAADTKAVAERVVRKGRCFLLLIAVDSYQHCSPLQNCVNDAEAIRNVLQERYQFLPEHTLTLYNEAATEENILRIFEQLIHELGENDSLVFLFSGHGEYYAPTRRGYWIPVEAKEGQRSEYLNNSEVTDFIKALKARHVFGLVDSCFSEALFSRNLTDAASQRLVSIPSRWLLTAGRLEPVSDGSLGGHSPFSERLIRHLSSNEEDCLWASELCTRVIKGMEFNANKQMPRGEPLQDCGHEGGQFVFLLKNTSPKPT